MSQPKIIVEYIGCEPGAKPDHWRLVEPVEVSFSHKVTLFVIPAGYVTDFASVPPILWSLCPPIGRYNLAALVHDYLYEHRYCEAEVGAELAREWADEQFLRIANQCHPEGHRLHYIMYLFLRWFGAAWWRRN